MRLSSFFKIYTDPDAWISTQWDYCQTARTILFLYKMIQFIHCSKIFIFTVYCSYYQIGIYFNWIIFLSLSVIVVVLNYHFFSPSDVTLHKAFISNNGIHKTLEYLEEAIDTSSTKVCHLVLHLWSRNKENKVCPDQKLNWGHSDCCTISRWLIMICSFISNAVKSDNAYPLLVSSLYTPTQSK